MKQQIILRIYFDPLNMDAPNLWDWRSLLDTEKVEVATYLTPCKLSGHWAQAIALNIESEDEQDPPINWDWQSLLDCDYEIVVFMNLK